MTNFPIFEKMIMIAAAWSGFCILQLLVRPTFIADGMYSFMFINLFLAWIPLLSSLIFRAHTNQLVRISSFIIWFGFLPNSGYVITDLWHINDFSRQVIWFDVIMLFSFAANSVLIANLSLSIIHNYLLKRMTEFWSWVLIIGIMLMNAIGIYAGRFLRFNSWDIVFHPLNSASSIIDRYTDIVLHPIAYPFTILMTSLLLFQYLPIKLILSYNEPQSPGRLKKNHQV